MGYYRRTDAKKYAIGAIKGLAGFIMVLVIIDIGCYYVIPKIGRHLVFQVFIIGFIFFLILFMSLYIYQYKKGGEWSCSISDDGDILLTYPGNKSVTMQIEDIDLILEHVFGWEGDSSSPIISYYFVLKPESASLKRCPKKLHEGRKIEFTREQVCRIDEKEEDFIKYMTDTFNVPFKKLREK